MAEYVYAHGQAGYLPEPVDKYEFIRNQLFNTEYEELLPKIYKWPEELMKPQE